MSTTEGIDAVLCDRLKELGLDFVAEVIEGTRKPTTEQFDVLRLGYPLRRPIEQGIPLIGGCADGRRVQSDSRRITMPMSSSSPIWDMDPQRDLIARTTYDTYHIERLAANKSTFSFFVVDSMPIENAIEQLIDGYKRVHF